MAGTGAWRRCNGIFHLVTVEQEGTFNVAIALGGGFALR